METGVVEMLAKLSQSFEGERYGFPKIKACNLDEIGPYQELASWLQTGMMI